MSLAARLGPIPRLSFIKDIHYDPAAKLEQLMAKAGLPEEPGEADTDSFVEGLMSDLRLETDAGEVRRDAILRVLETAAVKSRADHRSRIDTDQADNFTKVRVLLLLLFPF